MRPKVDPIEQLELFGGPRVTISIFGGPLDLLLHLVRRQEVDIYELRVAEITGEYLQMIGTMAELNVEVSGEFLVLASTLCLLKSRMLLPATEAEVDDEADGDEIDPQEDLANRLAEYRVFKEAADALADARQTRQQIYLRAENVDPELQSGPIMLDDVSVFDLVTVFQDLLSRASEAPVMQVPRETVTVRDRIHAITEMLLNAPEEGVAFFNLVSFPTTRMVIVMTFLAVLELIRRTRVTVTQNAPHGDIYLRLISRHGSVPPVEAYDESPPTTDDE